MNIIRIIRDEADKKYKDNHEQNCIYAAGMKRGIELAAEVLKDSDASKIDKKRDCIDLIETKASQVVV